MISILLFNDKFDSLSQQQKARYAEAFLNKLNHNLDEINQWTQADRKSVEKKNYDNLDMYRRDILIVENNEKMEGNIRNAKIKHLDVFNYCDVSKLNVLTPEMEDGIKGFVADYFNDNMKILHAFNTFHDLIGDAILGVDENIQSRGITSFISKEMREKVERKAKLKDENENANPSQDMLSYIDRKLNEEDGIDSVNKAENHRKKTRRP